MLYLLNRFILFFIPFLPISMVRIIAGRYVAGDNSKTALNIVNKLNQQGYSATIDILGEHTSSEKDAEDVTMKYGQLYDLISQKKLDCNVSIKPSHIGLDIGENIARGHLFKILEKAKKTDNFVRIDMEDSTTTDKTIQLSLDSLKKYPKVGTVFQAYLFRTENDIISLMNHNFNFRLCKGIYKEDPSIAIQDRDEINDNFLKLLHLVFKGEGFVGIATHDIGLLEKIYFLIDKLDINPNRFEFQVLYGVPMSGWLKKHLKNGYKVRVYVPFGPDWYAYSTRRIRENPNIIGYILSNIFKRK